MEFNIDTDDLSIPCSFSPTEITTCVVGITSVEPYDKSEFANTSTTYNMQINYHDLNKLYKYIVEDKSINNNDTLNQNLLIIEQCYKSYDIKMIFRFLCSIDCVNGEKFIDQTSTKLVYDFVNIVSKRTNCLIEFSDHSLGSFVSNWTEQNMSIECPIKLKTFTHAGKFTMNGKKSDFENSSHPTLKQIGDMSCDEDIIITFNNMSGTKVYEIVSNNVKLISNGKQELKNNEFSNSQCFVKKTNMDNNNDFNIEKIYSTVPVHCEFDYNQAKIVLSSTHWCNLNSVESPINLPKLRRYCTESIGYKATEELDNLLLLTSNEQEQKEIISSFVRDVSSGSKKMSLRK